MHQILLANRKIAPIRDIFRGYIFGNKRNVQPYKIFLSRVLIWTKTFRFFVVFYKSDKGNPLS